ncbi:hypothetical protein [Pseudomonas nitroreducens]|uniref:hypothetical protein n=1 Tax=Pseudomonas nitroreducens TaxID=46680 RepID=UPI003CC81B57
MSSNIFIANPWWGRVHSVSAFILVKPFFLLAGGFFYRKEKDAVINALHFAESVQCLSSRLLNPVLGGAGLHFFPRSLGQPARGLGLPHLSTARARIQETLSAIPPDPQSWSSPLDPSQLFASVGDF